MDPLFVSSVISNLLSILFLIYVLFRFFELSFLNPIVKYSFSILEPFTKPFRLILPVIFKIDLASLALSIIFKGLSFYLYVESQSLETNSIESISWSVLSVFLTISLVVSVILTNGSLTSSSQRSNNLAAYFTGLGLLSTNIE